MNDEDREIDRYEAAQEARAWERDMMEERMVAAYRRRPKRDVEQDAPEERAA